MAPSFQSDAHRIITEQLARLGGPQRHGDTDIFIPCPFHDDTQPSCGVCVTPGSVVPVGYFSCFGCSEKGPWNKLADKLGLAKVTSDDSVESGAFLDRGRLERRRAKVGMSGSAVEMPPGVAYPYRRWRGIPGSAVRRSGGVLATDRRGDVHLYLPVDRDRDGRECELVGVIRAALRKRKGKPGYVLEGGSQVGGGVFPLRLAEPMLAEGKSTVLALVEGQRDALRLCAAGVPALAIISTTHWGPEKAQSMAWICRRHGVRPLVMMDGDDAGDKAQRRVLADLSEHSFDGGPVARVDLARLGAGLDPANMPESLLRSIRAKALTRR